MINIPGNNILVADGDFAPAKGYGSGHPISIELSGDFGGATVALGYVSSDNTPVFVADLDAAGVALTKTTAGRWFTNHPASGRPSLRISGATVATAILVAITDLPR